MLAPYIFGQAEHYMKKLEWLEAMRGIAACWVLLSHAWIAAVAFVGPLPPALRLLENGYLGVDFFFVLSGFIIATSSRALAASGRGWRDYATARMLRIYVPYLPIGVAMLLLYGALPTVSQGARGEVGTLTSLTLLPTNAPPALSVAWTLVHEVLFYAIFGLFFVSRRALLALLAIWGGGIVGVWAAKLGLSKAMAYLLSPLNLCFILGVGLEWLTRRGVKNWFGVAAAMLGAVLVLSQAMTLQANRPLLAIGFAALIAAARSQWALAVSPGRILMSLGAASYAIYLVHNTAISAAVRAAQNVGDPVLCLVLVSGVGLGAGLAYHYGYEKFALRWVRAQLARTGFVRRRKTIVPATPAP